MATAAIRRSAERTIERPPVEDVLAMATLASLPASRDIETRAYELFLERGAEHGRDVEDWLQAERELML